MNPCPSCAGVNDACCDCELQAYRDLGSVGHLRELVQAVGLVGQMVYVIEGVYKGKKRIAEKVVAVVVDHITIGQSGTPVLDGCTEDGTWYEAMEAGEYHLTHEEAEATLHLAEKE